MPHPLEPSTTHLSVMTGVGEGDAWQWIRFNQIYRAWLSAIASSRLGPQYRDLAEDAVQQVLAEIARQLKEKKWTYEPDVGKLRPYLQTAVQNAVTQIWKQERPKKLPRKRKGGPVAQTIVTDKDPVPEEKDRRWTRVEMPDSPTLNPPEPLEALEASFLLTTLRRVVHQVRDRKIKKNAVMWKCFQEQVVARRPVAEIMAEYGISRELVYQNLSRILQDILMECKKNNDADFTVAGVLELFEKLKPSDLNDICGHLLDVEGKDSARAGAEEYFGGLLRDHLPRLEKETHGFGPSHWPAFQSYTRAIALQEDPPRPTPEVDRLLLKVDRLFRHQCLGEHDSLEIYDNFRLDRDNAGSDPDAVARLCGWYFLEGSADDDE